MIGSMQKGSPLGLNPSKNSKPIVDTKTANTKSSPSTQPSSPTSLSQISENFNPRISPGSSLTIGSEASSPGSTISSIYSESSTSPEKDEVPSPEITIIPPLETIAEEKSYPLCKEERYQGDLLLNRDLLHKEKANIPHGKGKITYQDGSTYVGEFSHGKRHGFGKIKLIGTTDIWAWCFDSKPPTTLSQKITIDKLYLDFEGEWLNDEMYKGSFIQHFDSEFDEPSFRFKYTGEVKDLSPHGTGTIEYPSKPSWDTKDITIVKYSGQWKNGVAHGEGELLYSNGRLYKGSFSNGKRHGLGFMTYANIDRNVENAIEYCGFWEKGTQNGYGTMTYSRGKVYKGNWIKGEWDDNAGILTTPEYKFKGHFKNNKICGLGKLDDFKDTHYSYGFFHRENLILHKIGEHTRTSKITGKAEFIDVFNSKGVFVERKKLEENLSSEPTIS